MGSTDRPLLLIGARPAAVRIAARSGSRGGVPYAQAAPALLPLSLSSLLLALLGRLPARRRQRSPGTCRRRNRRRRRRSTPADGRRARVSPRPAAAAAADDARRLAALLPLMQRCCHTDAAAVTPRQHRLLPCCCCSASASCSVSSSCAPSSSSSSSTDLCAVTHASAADVNTQRADTARVGWMQPLLLADDKEDLCSGVRAPLTAPREGERGQHRRRGLYYCCFCCCCCRGTRTHVPRTLLGRRRAAIGHTL